MSCISREAQTTEAEHKGSNKLSGAQSTTL